MQLKDYLKAVERRFARAGLAFGHGTANARDEAVYLIYTRLGIDFDNPIDSLNQDLGADEQRQLDALVERRIDTQVPMAYLLGQAWFAGHRFLCDPRALIPRSPIGELIVNDFQPLLRNPPGRILDLGTGGGCIGIACALQFPRSRVVLSDISADCLQLADENIALHKVCERVRTLKSDLFARVAGKFDLIVSNPPYVAAEDIAALPGEYRHEPRQGLLSGDAGLAIPLAILRQAASHLNEDGILIMEVGLAADRLDTRLSRIPFLWLEFEEGGEGVLALTARQLTQYRDWLN